MRANPHPQMDRPPSPCPPSGRDPFDTEDRKNPISLSARSIWHWALPLRSSNHQTIAPPVTRAHNGDTMGSWRCNWCFFSGLCRVKQPNGRCWPCLRVGAISPKCENQTSRKQLSSAG